MKRLSINYFFNEDILTLFLSILLWVVSLLIIYFFANIFFTEETTHKEADTDKVVRYYEEMLTSEAVMDDCRECSEKLLRLYSPDFQV